MKRITFIILLSIIIVVLVAIIVFSVNPQSQAPKTNVTSNTTAQQINLTLRPIIAYENPEIKNERL